MKELSVLPSDEVLQDLVGRRFPGGSFTVAAYQHWLMSDAIRSTPLRDGTAHPMYAYYAALGGMGITLDELFAWAGACADDGVMFGEASIDLREELRIGATYRVSGGITGVERKTGRRVGGFDVVTFELEMHDGDRKVAVSTNSFVFPRGL